MSALRGLLLKETYHILRDRRTLVVVLMFPLIQVLIFGYAIRTDVRDIRLVVVDPSPDHATHSIRSTVLSTGLFVLVDVVRTQNDLQALFEKNEAQVALVFEPGFAGRMGTADAPQLLIITDTTEPNTGATIQSHLLRAIRGWERTRAPARQDRATITPEVRLWFNPTAESKNLFVPGLMAFVLTIISSLMTAITLTREKETGTMESLLVSPLRPWEIVAGKVAPYLVIGFISVIAVLLEARLVFDVPLRGSVGLLLAEGMLFILVSLAIGILISSRTSSQRVAMTGALLGTMLPTMMLSGFIFPLESMPDALQIVANAVPAKWFVTIARGIMLKGVGLEVLWEETLVLLAMAIVLLALSVRSFHERLS